MDAKVTLHFDKAAIEQAKAFAARNNISLSRLTEFLYKSITSGNYQSLDELPIAEWVQQISEGEVQYKRSSNKERTNEYLNSKR